MSVGIGASGSGAVPPSINFFLELPEEILQVVLTYMTHQDGLRLMSTQKALNGRLVDILVDEQSKYFTCLCERMRRYFLFTPQEFRQKIGEVGEEVISGEGKPFTLDVLGARQRAFTEKIICVQKDFPGYSRSVYLALDLNAFFSPFHERVAKDLVHLGTDIIYRDQSLLSGVIALAEKEEQDEVQREFYIEIATWVWKLIKIYPGQSVEGAKKIPGEEMAHLITQISHEQKRKEVMNMWIEGVEDNDPFLKTEEFHSWISPTALFNYLVKSKEMSKLTGEEAFHLINKITNKRSKEKAIDIWIETVDENDPFLKTEEFASWVTPLALMKHVMKRGARGREVLLLFDKTIKHPYQGVRREVLFRFFHHWCQHGYAFEASLYDELYPKVSALIETLPEEERNVGLLEVLKGMVAARFFPERMGDPYDYIPYAFLYLKHQVDQEGASPMHILEALPQIRKQIGHYFWIRNDICPLFRYYQEEGNVTYHLVAFFIAAMIRTREEEERSRLLNSALEQVTSYGRDKKHSLIQEIHAYFRGITRVLKDRANP